MATLFLQCVVGRFSGDLHVVRLLTQA